MLSFLAPSLLVGCFLGAEVGPVTGYLYQPSFEMDEQLRPPARPYFPQPGDIFFSTDKLLIIRAGHAVAGANAPHHSGIVFTKPDGTWYTLEAGPHNSLKIKALNLKESLSGYEAAGNKVWVRRRFVPATAEQSRKLTEFASAQDGKQFALLRMLAQVTPIRSRGTQRTYYMGYPQGDRNRYWCAELLTECCGASGLLDCNRIRPSATYPSDLFYGKSKNPFINENLDVNKFWEPPARWTVQLPQPH